MFEYFPGLTSDDDVIEHILMRLNTDFAGMSLQVPDFCRINSHDYDRIMEKLVRTKMYRHCVAQPSDGKGQPDTAIMLSSFGVEVFRKGGWKVYLKRLVEKRNTEKAQEDYKNKLELEKTERENEKLIYEKSMRKLDAENKQLSTRNLQLQNSEIIYRWFSGITGLILGAAGSEFAKGFYQSFAKLLPTWLH